MDFGQFANYLSRLEKTASRNVMTAILADLFKTSSKQEIGRICYLLQGRVAPLYEAIEFGIADKLIMRAISQACKVELDLVNKEFKKAGDLGSAAELIKSNRSKSNLSIEDVFQLLSTLAITGGEGSQEKKIQLLAELIRELDSLSVRYVLRIPLDKLRLGFSEMTILDALSWMLKGDKSLREEIENAYNVRPDIGFIAQIIKERGIAGLKQVKLKLGVPVLAALCQRIPTAEEMLKKMGEVAVEAKYDGVRVQIHFVRGKVQSFSRNLENTTEMFPELQKISKQIKAAEVILDSEAVGLDPVTGKLIPFQETVTRKRKHDIEQAILNVPLKFFVFDLLFYNGKDLLETPFSERRKLLEGVVQKGEILVISPQIVTKKTDELTKYHELQLHHGLEGVVVKKWHSSYEPGRRGYNWVKFKGSEGQTGKLDDTIDAVVMGYYLGEGKRSGFGIGAFLVGVRDQDKYVSVTKIGTGVSDEQWQDLQKEFSHQSSVNRPKEYQEVEKTLIPDYWIKPKIVVEIAADDITKSPTHGAEFALRFPRLVRVRRDKGAHQVTTIKEIQQMFQNQKNR